MTVAKEKRDERERVTTSNVICGAMEKREIEEKIM